MLVNNLLARESTAGETRMRLMWRSEFVLIYKGTASQMLGPRMQVQQKRES